jgi:hypothetical protein
MQIKFSSADVTNPLDVLRKAGYIFFIDPQSKKESFILRLTNGYYPRFHLYVEEDESTVNFNLHLDQKKPSYAGSNMHGGEYDGKRVEDEMARVHRWISATYPVAIEISKKKQGESPEPVEEAQVSASPATATPPMPESLPVEEAPVPIPPEKKPFGGIFG